MAAILDVAVEPHDQGRNQRSREHIACQHGEDDRFGQGHEEIARNSGEEKHRHEHNADAKRRDERRQGDFLRPVEDRLDVGLAQRHLAVNVFDFNRRIVHENADGQRQTAERHEVDGLAQGAEQGKGGEHRKRNREGDDEGAPPGAEKEQNHHRRQRRSDHALLYHAVHGRADEERLVGEFLYLQLGREAAQNPRHGLFHAVHDTRVDAAPLLRMVSSTPRTPSSRTTFCCG